MPQQRTSDSTTTPVVNRPSTSNTWIALPDVTELILRRLVTRLANEVSHE